MNRGLLVALFILPFAANAVVIRSDVDDSKYRIAQSEFPALADMPGEGHGVLIARKWVVTAAHAAPMEGMDAEISVNGKGYKVARVIVHPGYKRMPDALGQEALKTGDPSRIHAFLAGSDDMALIELETPVEQITPVALYRGSDEVTEVAMFVGKGATGNGIEGQSPNAPHRGVMRRAYNSITGADDRYVWYRFDPPAQGLPLEGVLGSGDSGGPLVVHRQGAWQLIGLGSWITAVPEHALEAGFYGQMVYNVRISRYVTWIDGVMCAADGGSCTKAGQPLNP
ncbi:S1 family peptidase [Stenotrophomonas sp. AB1(2024)]|uniref:S1 family peptidase n=1 Tax=Stenotrophomonas sp. AB1(2024) TaxID=3132215 RepID=UPI0038FB27E6